jgi:hypothetical protein
MQLCEIYPVDSINTHQVNCYPDEIDGWIEKTCDLVGELPCLWVGKHTVVAQAELVRASDQLACAAGEMRTMRSALVSVATESKKSE